MMAFASRLASGPTSAVRWTKMAINQRLRDEVNLVLDASLHAERSTMMAEDHREGVRALKERRDPRFKGM